MTLAEISRAEIEDFLFLEAALLDDWKLPEWRALFVDECSYLVPNPSGSDPYAPVDSTLYLVAHSEYPRSRTRHMISNVRILGRDEASLRSQCSFVTYRTNQGITDTYFGRHEHLLVMRDGALRISEKRSILDTGALRPQGRLSIIV
jgi:p-cumate 2,3-dioxygenase beta subunit